MADKLHWAMSSTGFSPHSLQIRANCRRFSVGRDYAEKLQERIRRTMEFTDNEKPVISVLVTTYGIERNDYAGKFQKVITMQDLFRF